MGEGRNKEGIWGRTLRSAPERGSWLTKATQQVTVKLQGSEVLVTHVSLPQAGSGQCVRSLLATRDN